MPTYRVILTKREWTGGDTWINPFNRRIPDSDLLSPSGWITRKREWIFDADSPEHVKQLYEEAVELKLEQLIGFELASIKEIDYSA